MIRTFPRDGDTQERDERSQAARRRPLRRAALCRCLNRILLTTILTTAMTTLHAQTTPDDGDALDLIAGYSVRYESNLFRLADDADTQAALGQSSRSDLVGIATAGIRVNKPYSLQRFELEAFLVDYRYRDFDYLDFTARNYAGAWRWQLHAGAARQPDRDAHGSAQQLQRLHRLRRAQRAHRRAVPLRRPVRAGRRMAPARRHRAQRAAQQ
ncbi:MAG: hypothetical protein QM739_18780 [Propionivibrio sp.]